MLRCAQLLVPRMASLSLNNSTSLISQIQQRNTSFLVKVKADDLWKGVTSVSNAGRKRGRASGASRKLSKDLNKGQIMGVGKVNMIWPGLNAPVVRGKELVTQTTLPQDKEREEKLLAIRNKQLTFRPPKLTPLERGWSGTRAPGRSVGPPEAIGDETFEGFDCTVVELKMVATMKGHLGRTRRHKAVVVCGNKEGLIGVGACKAPDARSALRKAKNMAIKRLTYVNRFENHTVLHDFYCEFGSAKLIVKKKQHGYGLVCHRVIQEVCKAVGISDLYVKLDVRSSSPLCMIRALLLGLHNQKTHQQVADEKCLHVVEFRQENDNFPRVMASPGAVRTKEQLNPNEELDFDLVVSEGKLVHMKPKTEPFFTRLPSWEVYLKKTDNLKNDKTVRMKLIKKYGGLKSFLTIAEEQAKTEEAVKVEKD